MAETTPAPRAIAFALLRLAALIPLRVRLLLLLLWLAANLTEGVGILLLLPLLQLLQTAAEAPSPGVDGLRVFLGAVGLPLRVETLLGVFCGLIVLRSALLYSQEVLGAQVRLQVVDQLRQRCFAALLGVEWRWLVRGRRSDYAHLLLTEVNRVGMGLQFVLGLLTAAVALGAYLGVALLIAWPMTLLAVGSGAGVFYLLTGHRRAALKLGQALSVASRAVQANVQESLAGIKLVKILGNEQRHLDLLDQVSGQLRAQQMRFVASNGLSRALFQIGGAWLLAAYLYLGWVVWQLPIAELLVLVLVFSRVIPMFTGMQQQYHHLLHTAPALHELERLLAECQRAAEPIPPIAAEPWPVRTAIQLQQASVSYAERSQPALADISLHLPARTTTAIIGASGAGKSTLADVLMGLLELDQGQLTIDGVLVTGAARLRWRRATAYVPQESFLFHASIRQNLLWGHAAATDADLRAVLQQAAADFVWALPQGLETVVGDGGICLSGGERQRLALARALLARPSLLILDEATSALDPENEARIRTAIETLHGDLTVVLIGHRLATLEHADQVICLAQGRIIAQGTWEQVQSHRKAALE